MPIWRVQLGVWNTVLRTLYFQRPPTPQIVRAAYLRNPIPAAAHDVVLAQIDRLGSGGEGPCALPCVGRAFSVVS